MTAMRDAYIVTALNPKAIVFFVAFVPAFLDPAKPFLPQALVLIVSFVTMAAANALFYALVAARLSGKISRPGAWNGFNRLGGGVLMGAGIATALMRR